MPLRAMRQEISTNNEQGASEDAFPEGDTIRERSGIIHGLS